MQLRSVPRSFWQFSHNRIPCVATCRESGTSMASFGKKRGAISSSSNKKDPESGMAGCLMDSDGMIFHFRHVGYIWQTCSHISELLYSSIILQLPPAGFFVSRLNTDEEAWLAPICRAFARLQFNLWNVCSQNLVQLLGPRLFEEALRRGSGTWAFRWRVPCLNHVSMHASIDFNHIHLPDVCAGGYLL